jgi:hypothetical protein
VVCVVKAFSFFSSVPVPAVSVAVPLLALVLLGPLACGGGDSPGASDGGGEALPSDGSSTDGIPEPTLEKGGSGSGDVSASLSSTQVRAGKVTSSGQLLSGVKVQGKVGDFKIYNSRVAFIIRDTRFSDGWAPYGGEILDAAQVGKTSPKGRSVLGETIFGPGLRIAKPTSVGVVKDGSDGKEAIVRVIGQPAVAPFIEGLLGNALTNKFHAYIVYDYILAPDSEAIEIRLRIMNTTSTGLSNSPFLLGITAGDGVDLFAEEIGFDITGGGAGQLDYVGMVGEDVAYGLVSLEQKLVPFISHEGIWVLSTTGLTVAARSETSRKFQLVVTDGEPEALRRAVRKLKGTAEPAKVSGKVVDSAGTAVANARIHVVKDGSSSTYETMTRSDSTGAYALGLSSGSYTMTVVAEARDPVTQALTVGASAVTQDLTLGGTASVAYTVVDGEGTALPSKLFFKRSTSPTSLSRSFGERTYSRGASLIVYSTTGSGTAALTPGTYTITASRGFEYEIDASTLTLADGDSQSVAFTLERSVDTTGYMCGDFHVHALWSPDSSDLNELKVAALAAEGLEIPVITDHEYVSDLNPTVAKLGLQKWLYVVVGEELTTLVYGHFNPYPITQDSTQVNKGAVTWYQKSPGELFADVRKAWPNAVLQVNHPRVSTLGGYLTYVGYNPKTGTATLSSEWSRDFDALEVFSGGHASMQGGVPADWFSFLDRGFLVTATGNSDNHHVYTGEVGNPRNYVKLSTDDPTKLSLAELAKAVKAQKVVVSGGAFITAEVGGKSFGEVADATDKKPTISIKVQAPTWVSLDTLTINVGGSDYKTITLDSSTADPKNPVVRYNDSVELSVSADTYVVVMAKGSQSLSPVTGTTPFASTNPIYLDVDGNGKYDAPKSW